MAADLKCVLQLKRCGNIPKELIDELLANFDKIAVDDTITGVTIGTVATINVIANDVNADPTTVELYNA